MIKTVKENNIEKLEKELYVAHKNGYIFRSTHIYEPTFGDTFKIIGVEILFADDVPNEKIQKIKTYVETTYGFLVDTTTYMSPSEHTKIIIVRY